MGTIRGVESMSLAIPAPDRRGGAQGAHRPRDRAGAGRRRHLPDQREARLAATRSSRATRCRWSSCRIRTCRLRRTRCAASAMTRRNCPRTPRRATRSPSSRPSMTRISATATRSRRATRRWCRAYCLPRRRRSCRCRSRHRPRLPPSWHRDRNWAYSALLDLAVRLQASGSAAGAGAGSPPRPARTPCSSRRAPGPLSGPRPQSQPRRPRRAPARSAPR